MNELDVTCSITAVLEQHAIPYCVGGSFGSTVFGEARATRDVDILAALQPSHITPLVHALEPDFYLQHDDIREAVLLAPTLRGTPYQRATFNMIHRSSFFKADIFVSSGRPFDQSQFARRVELTLGLGQRFAIASAEDTILAKLEWYRMGNEVSERQWRDVLAVLAAQEGALDPAYLWQWARMLGIEDLLERAWGRTAHAAE